MILIRRWYVGDKGIVGGTCAQSGGMGKSQRVRNKGESEVRNVVRGNRLVSRW